MTNLGNQEDLVQFVIDLLPSNSPESLKRLVREDFTEQLEAVIERQKDIAINGDLQTIICKD